MNKRLVTAFLALFVFFSFLGRASALQSTDASARKVERLVRLCQLWAAVKYFHPYLAYRDDIDWDAALVSAIPKVTSAATDEEYAASVERMLRALRDPVTRVVSETSPTTPNRDGSPPSFRWTEDKILIVQMDYAGFMDFFTTRQKLVEVSREFEKAKSILFDLRSAIPLTGDKKSAVGYAFSSRGIGALSSVPLSAPGQRGRLHMGFVPQSGGPTGSYSSAFITFDVSPIPSSPDSPDVPVVFLTNANSAIPPVALALQTSGQGAIVGEGDISEASVVSTHSIPLGGLTRAEIRLTEVIHEDGSGGLQADVVVPASEAPGEADPAFEAALSLVRDFKTRTTPRRPLPARAAPAVDKSYADMQYPAVEYRLLGAFRIWAVINYFFPYKDLMGENWDDVLREFIPKMEKAKNAREYHLAVAEMVTHIHDTHGRVRSPVLDEYFGSAPPPVRVQIIEGHPVVTRLADSPEVQDSKIEVGDIVLAVDGEEAGDRIARYSRYLAASTPQSLRSIVAVRLLAGPEDSTVSLTLRNRMGEVKQVKLPRKYEYRRRLTLRTGEITKVLPGNIAYADLDRLEVSMVDEMFERFKGTSGIILDMRGYPKGTAWSIAPRLTEENSPAAALFERPTVMYPDGPQGELKSQSTIYQFVQSIPSTDKWRYKGKTVMLIDGNTISQAEHTGLFFEAANDTKFVGSHTAGANGDVTNLWVPGGILVRFSGQAVKHADGRQLQRIGLVPHVEARPTIEAIQSGRDEVLEKALEYLQKELR